MEFIDPHFHYWDITPNSQPGHNATYLGNIGKRYPVYTPQHYLQHMKLTGLKLKKAVFVEAISDKPLEETKWVASLAKSNEAQGIPHAIVAYAPLHQPDVEKLLIEYSKIPGVVGIRQILNHHPTNTNLTWPKIDQDYLHNPTWRSNYALLEKYHLSFDLQLNPHQLKSAAQFIANYPRIPVIVNHLATLHLGDTDDQTTANIAVWREGMQALSKLPHVTVKLSMLMFIKPQWETSYQGRQFIGGLVREVIAMFGTERCMFASNYPVDDLSASPKQLYDAFSDIVSHLTPREKNDLFYATADRVYRFKNFARL